MILKDIPGFEGRYMIDVSGNVQSIKLGRFMTSFIGTTGYWMVNLKIGKKQHMRRVHRLLALTFLQPVEGKIYINHKNGIRTDNRLENLEWCTMSENIKHSYDVLKRPAQQGETNGRSKMILDLQTGIFYPSIQFAAQAKGYTREFLKSKLTYYKGKFNDLMFV